MVKTICIFMSCLLMAAGACLGQGTLTPPDEAFGTNGAPAATMKTLDQIEPRKVITALPFTITNSGSYYVAGNLMGSNGQHGVVIDADNVQLDLNGFALIGSDGGPDTNLTLTGIEIADDPIHKSITIRNGVIVNWGKYGIRSTLAIDCKISDMTVAKNGSTNGWDGMSLGVGWRVTDCRAQENSGTGIKTVGACMLQGTVLKNNGLHGANLGSGSYASDCISSGNGGDGIRLSDVSIIRDCLVSNNSTNGIVVGEKCVVSRNSCVWNTMGAGVLAGGSCRIDDNHLVANRAGVKQSSGTDTIAIRNTAVDNTVGGNFDLQGDTHYGAVLTNLDLGRGFTNANPWANFSL